MNREIEGSLDLWGIWSFAELGNINVSWLVKSSSTTTRNMRWSKCINWQGLYDLQGKQMKAVCGSHLVILVSVRKTLSVGNLLLVLVIAPVPMERWDNGFCSLPGDGFYFHRSIPLWGVA